MTKLLQLKLKINLIGESTFSNETLCNILRLHITEACTHTQVRSRLLFIFHTNFFYKTHFLECSLDVLQTLFFERFGTGRYAHYQSRFFFIKQSWK